jgi:hypothetical protein
MRDGRFNTSKCRGKLQKMGVLCTHPQSSPGPCNMQGPLKSKKNKFNFFFIKKCRALSKQVATAGGRKPRAIVALPATVGRPAVGRPLTDQQSPGQGRPMVGARLAASDRSCEGPSLSNPLPPPSYLFVPKFFHMWSSLPHWLQHMPACPDFS